MSRIARYELRIIARSTVVMTTSYGPAPQEKEHVIVRLEDEDGQQGWGESTPLPEFSGETTSVVELVLRTILLPCVVGSDSFDIVTLHEKMDHAICGNNAAKMAIETAAYDLNAKKFGVPLYVLLGGRMRNNVVINRHIGIIKLDDAVKLALEYVKQGVKSIKMKVGADVQDDASRVRAVRTAVGRDIRIRVDANGGYDIVKARDFVRRVIDCDLEMYEQLISPGNLDGAAALRHFFGISLCADEGLCTPSDALAHVEKEAADFFTIKLVKTGGIYPALQIASIAQAAGIGCVIASTFDTQINGAACLHLACALQSVNVACDLTCYATQSSMADTCHVLSDGKLNVGAEPGIGVRSLSEFQIAKNV